MPLKNILSVSESRVVPIDDLHDDPDNPRFISEAELASLVASIRHFGYVEPIVVNEREVEMKDGSVLSNVIVGGHQRVKALRIIGETEVPAVFGSWDKDDMTALNIALNKIGGQWDEQALARNLELLMDVPDYDVSLTGFDPDLAMKLIDTFRVEAPESFPDAGMTAEDQEYRCPSCNYSWSGDPKPRAPQE